MKLNFELRLFLSSIFLDAITVVETMSLFPVPLTPNLL